MSVYCRLASSWDQSSWWRHGGNTGETVKVSTYLLHGEITLNCFKEFRPPIFHKNISLNSPVKVPSQQVLKIFSWQRKTVSCSFTDEPPYNYCNPYILLVLQYFHHAKLQIIFFLSCFTASCRFATFCEFDISVYKSTLTDSWLISLPTNLYKFRHRAHVFEKQMDKNYMF